MQKREVSCLSRSGACMPNARACRARRLPDGRLGEVGRVPEARDTWRKSSFCGNESECVEVAMGGARVRARDSKDRAGAELAFSPAEWRAFIAAVACGELEAS